MAQRRAPGPDSDGPEPDGPTSRSLGPFIGAVAVVAVLAILVVLAQVFAPSDDIDDPELINRTVGDYVRAHNEGDDEILTRLRCDDLAAEDAPLDDVGTVDFGGSGNVVVDGDAATVDVTVTVDGARNVETWHVIRAGDLWRICTG